MTRSFTKKALASAILATLPLTVSAAGFNGFVEGSYDRNDVSSNDVPWGSSDGNDLSLRGTLAYDFANNFGLQGDFVHSRSSFSLADNFPADFGTEGTRETTDLALHAYYSEDNWRAGAFVQHRSHNHEFDALDPSADAAIDYSSDVLSPDELMLGIEGQGFFGDFDVTGQVGKVDWERVDVGGPGFKVDGIFFSVDAGYLIHDNWRVGVNYSQSNLDNDGEDFNINAISLNTEYRLNDSPVSLFASYTRHSFDDADTTINGDRFAAGIKISFGESGSSIRESRTKSSFNPVRQSQPIGSLLFRHGAPVGDI